MSIVLALDVSSLSTGWCCFKHGRFYRREGTDYGVIKGNSRLNPAERLSIFRKEVSTLIYMTKPNLIGIEDVFSGPNRKTFKVLSRFNGVALEVSRTIGGIEPIVVPATEWRTLWGTQAKKEIFSRVVEKYKLNDLDFNKDNDITDAIGLAFYVHKIGVNKNEK